LLDLVRSRLVISETLDRCPLALKRALVEERKARLLICNQTTNQNTGDRHVEVTGYHPNIAAGSVIA